MNTLISLIQHEFGLFKTNETDLFDFKEYKKEYYHCFSYSFTKS
jgi:hypothetical protein